MNNINIQNKDLAFRFFLSSIILFVALYSSCYLLALLSIFLFYTIYKKHCFIYDLFKINERFSIKNYYIANLPKYNTSAVYIFDKKGKILFQNNASQAMFSHIKTLNDIEVLDANELFSSNMPKELIYTHAKSTYKIEIIPKVDDKLLLVYVNDVTKIMELNDEIEETQREIIYAMGEIGETRSKETGNHVKRVALYSEKLALLYGLSEEEASILKLASPMHDIGKVGIPDAILNAPRKLTEEEFEIMKTHAQLGHDMLCKSNKPILQAAAIVAGEHHEKFDGSGYPHAKSGEDIHIYGRITAIADVFDALGSERIYKKAWKLEDILALFNEQSGKHFDPKLIELFFNNLDDFLLIRDQFKD
jgi:putative two-component system response regulator